jgi:16S rRNA (cytosine967-C5)-methyltransferase
MTPSARHQAVLELLDLIETTPRPADSLMSAYFRGHRYIGSKDRAWVAEHAYDLIRHHARLNWWLERLGAPSTSRKRFLAYLRLVEKMSPGEIEGLWDGKKFAPAWLTHEEKKLVEDCKGHTLKHPDMPLTVAVECPPWAEVPLKARFGKNFTAEMAAMLSPAPLDLRINSIKTDRDTALNALLEGGFDVSPCKLSPLGLRLMNRPSLSNIKLLRDGAIEIQDEGSQLVAMLVDAKPGERVVDFCAGAGGKTLAIGAQMNNKGRIVACDVLANRLKRSAERFRRAGLHNIETHALSSESDPWVKRHKESFDRVLVDAPCSGTGTWRRNPDQRWRSLGPGLETLVPLQAHILNSAARLVKAGGRLVYATCSMLSEENENQIEAFLAAHDDFELLPPQKALPSFAFPNKDEPYLRLTPAQNDTDGFFAAILTRKAKAKEE